jgi:hypothetical protein
MTGYYETYIHDRGRNPTRDCACQASGTPSTWPLGSAPRLPPSLPLRDGFLHLHTPRVCLQDLSDPNLPRFYQQPQSGAGCVKPKYMRHHATPLPSISTAWEPPLSSCCQWLCCDSYSCLMHVLQHPTSLCSTSIRTL